MKNLLLCAYSFSLLLPAFGGDILLSPAGPIRTVIEARDAARAAAKPVRIVIAEGTYQIPETLALGAEDSQVTWSGKNAIFTAGKSITGWTKSERGLWKATLPENAWEFAFSKKRSVPFYIPFF